MSEPKRMVIWMASFLVITSLVCAALFSPLADAFSANRIFNGMIIGVLLIGIAINFFQVLTLEPAAAWLDDRENGVPALREPPGVLAPMVKMMSKREQEGMRISAMAMRSLLDGVRLRLDEARDIARYMVGLLIFLGLLGTFWGLLNTVGGVAKVISGLSAGTGDLSGVFDALKHDLQAPLSGMGTAFSSSLFGLSGALILGVLDLQAGHAQNLFYNRLEEWLSGMAHLPTGSVGVEGEHALPTYVEALLEQTAENLDQLQRTLVRGEEDRRTMQMSLARLTDQLSGLTDQLRTEQRITLNLAKNQADLQSATATFANQMSAAFAGYDEMRDHLRSADVSLAKLVKEVSLAREQVPEDLRKEVRLLAQSLMREPRART